jgi:hypothetical protein
MILSPFPIHRFHFIPCHTFRYSVATHLLERGYDIRTVESRVPRDGPQRREDDNDLYPCPQPRTSGRSRSGGRALSQFKEVVLCRCA